MAYRRSAATDARKEARRLHFLEVATHLFGQHGYHASTVPMIVAAAHSSVGSFYMYFRNKEEIFGAVVESLGLKLDAILQEALNNQPDPSAWISSAIEALFLYFAENPGEARIMIIESAGLSPQLEQISRRMLSLHVQTVHKALTSAPDQFSVADPAIAARCMVGGVCEAITSWLEQDATNRRTAVEVARAVADFHSRAVRKD